MKTLFAIFLFFALSASAVDRITVTVTVTNTPVNGDSLTLNASTRTWKPTATNTSSQITIGASIGANLTNLYNQIAANPFAGAVILTQTGTNAFTLTGQPGSAMAASISGTWGYLTLSTQVITSMIAVRVPVSAEPSASVRGAVGDGLVDALNDYAATNTFNTAAPALVNFVNTTETQTLSNKTLTGGTFTTGALTDTTLGYVKIPYSTTAETGIEFFSSGASRITTIAADANGIPTLYGTALYPVPTNDFGAYSPSGGNLLTRNAGDTYYGRLALANSWTGTNTFQQITNSLIVGSTLSGSIYSGTISALTGGTITGSTISGGTVGGTVSLLSGGYLNGVGGTNNLLTNATTKLAFDIAGDIAFQHLNYTSLANSNNAAIDFGQKTIIRITSGPTADFNLNGIANGRDGKVYEIYNLSGQTMTIANESGADPTPANRILTLTGADATFTGQSMVMLRYDSAQSRWIVANGWSSASIGSSKQNLNATLTSISSLTNAGVLVMNTVGSVTNRAIVPGSSKVTIVNTNAIAGDIAIDVDESAFSSTLAAINLRNLKTANLADVASVKAARTNLHFLEINLRVEGASGTVAGDATAILSACLEQCRTNGMSPVLFVPKGVFRLTSALSLSGFTNLVLRGESREGSVILLDNNPYPSTTASIFFQSCTNVTIENLTFQGLSNDDNTAYELLTFANTNSFVKISNCRFLNFRHSGVRETSTSYGNHFEIRDSLFEVGLTDAMTDVGGGGGILTSGAKDLTVDHCTFSNLGNSLGGSHALYVSGGTIARIYNSLFDGVVNSNTRLHINSSDTNSIVSGCTFNGQNLNYAGMKNGTITGNMFKNTRLRLLGCQGMAITGNTWLIEDGNSTTFAIDVTSGDSSDVVVVGNTFTKGTTGGGTSYAISIANNVLTRGWKIAENNIYGYGLATISYGTNHMLLNNTVVNPGTVSGINMGAAATCVARGNLFDIEGGSHVFDGTSSAYIDTFGNIILSGRNAVGNILNLSDATNVRRVPGLTTVQTWNDSGANQTAWKLSVTDTSSGAGALLADIQKDTVSKLSLSKAGNLTVAGSITGASFSGDGSALTALNASQLTSGTVPSARLSGAYSGITGLGTVASGVWNGTAISAPYGGTGFGSYAVGDILYADTTTSLAKLADVATGNVLLSGGVGTAPAYGKVALTTHVSGLLPLANGGSAADLSAVATGGLIYKGASALAGSGALTGIITGNGTSAPTAATTITSAQMIDPEVPVDGTKNVTGALSVSGSITAGTTVTWGGGSALAGSGGANFENDVTFRTDNIIIDAGTGVERKVSTGDIKWSSSTTSATTPVSGIGSRGSALMTLTDGTTDNMGSLGLSNVVVYGTATGNGSGLTALNATQLTSGTVPDARMPALTGDVTTSAGAVATTIANDAVTFAKFQNITQARLLGRYTASTGDMQEIQIGSGLALDSGTGVLTASGSGVGGSGTTGAIPYFSAGTTLADSPILRIGSGEIQVPAEVNFGATGTNPKLKASGAVLEVRDVSDSQYNHIRAASFKPSADGVADTDLPLLQGSGLNLGVGNILTFDTTITTPGTTGNQTIHKITGRVNIAAGGSSITVTNNLVSATSLVFPVIATDDSTAIIKNCVTTSGAFTIKTTAAVTAETAISFLVVNP